MSKRKSKLSKINTYKKVSKYYAFADTPVVIKKISIIPDKDTIEKMRNHSLNFINDFDDLNISELIILCESRINYIISLNPEKYSKHNLNFNKKSKDQLVRIFTIVQNQIIQMFSNV